MEDGSRPNRQITHIITDRSEQAVNVLWENHSTYSVHHQLQCVNNRESYDPRRADAGADCQVKHASSADLE